MIEVKLNDLVVVKNRLYEIRAITSGEYKYLCVNIEERKMPRYDYHSGFAMNEKFQKNATYFDNRDKVRYIGKASEHPECFV